MSGNGTGHGGRRPGAGRPKGSRTLHEDTRHRLLTARANKETALASLRALELRLKRGELIDREVSDLATMQLVANAKSRLLAMPGKLGPIVAAEASPVACQELIRAEVHAALAELAAGNA